MNTKKATKRALLTSVMALVMCVVMLVGTTFAWFTDTASTAVNKIQAGNLKVDIVDANDTSDSLTAQGKKLNFISAGAGDAVKQGEAILWEPGASYLTQGFKIKNDGNLALKWKIEINKDKIENGKADDTAKDGVSLLDVIDFSVVSSKDKDAEAVEIDKFVGHTAANTVDSDTYYIKGTMKTTAGNDYQSLTLDGITITVYATQDTVENDSFGPDYDKNADYLVYPANVTDAIFASKTDAEYSVPNTTTPSKAQAVAAYVDSNGDVQYTADVKTALDKGASTIYLKQGAKGRLMALSNYMDQPNRTSEITKDITIYANGADFEYGEIEINKTADGKNANFTIKVYDAKNLRVYGNTPNTGATQNIILENCTFEGKGINSSDDIASGGIFYLTGSSNIGTANLTMNNCTVTGSNQGVYSSANGTITINDCAFASCAAAMKISHKGSGTCNVTVKDTTFNNCGWNTEVTGKEWLKNDSSAIKCKTDNGTMTLTLNNVAITNMVGDNDIVTTSTKAVTVDATNVTVDGTAWTNSTTNP